MLDVSFMSPDEIADHLMLYKLTASALTEIRKVTLEDMHMLNQTSIGHDIRSMYGMWDPENPHTKGSFDPAYHVVDSDPRHPHNVSCLVLEIIWRRLR